MLESTRQRAQLPNSFGDGCHDLSDLTEWVDRAWSRRLAHIVVRILLLLVTRFHASPYVLLGITEFLEGAAFEEPAIRVSFLSVIKLSAQLLSHCVVLFLTENKRNSFPE